MVGSQPWVINTPGKVACPYGGAGGGCLRLASSLSILFIQKLRFKVHIEMHPILLDTTTEILQRIQDRKYLAGAK